MTKLLSQLMAVLVVLLSGALAQSVYFTGNLSLGAKGSNVTAVQNALLEAGHPQVGTADGIFGANTQSGVKAFQASNSLEADGVVGVNTWTMLFGAESYIAKFKEPRFRRKLMLQNTPMRGEDVTAVQGRLHELGYSELGKADGIFGAATRQAVLNFQRRLASAGGLKLTPNGIVDGITWANLFSIYAPEK